MLHAEFDKALGYKTTEEEYNKANLVYEEGDWVNNRDFCHDWKCFSETAKHQLYEMAGAKRKQTLNVMNCEKQIAEMKSNIEKWAKLCIDNGSSFIAEQIVSEDFIVKYKIESGHSLNDADLSFIHQLITTEQARRATN